MNTEKGKYRLQFHLMPPAGWLNDPNGLCQFQGQYHIFFQYAPDDARGSGRKGWGHYLSEDLVHFTYAGTPILPDIPEDKDGAYSGSALVDDGVLELFYTGNVKEDGAHDYIYSGRGANVIYVTSEDGVHFSKKQVLLGSQDYPETYTCHVRDPKVWKEADTYYMVLGGRKGERPAPGVKRSEKEDHGAILLYESKDKQKWDLVKEITTEEYFGYMWECPDYFTLKEKEILSFSPQGLEAQKDCYQNQYQSGYFVLEENGMLPPCSTFTEWDRGFDFYAPQTFLDAKGRRILIGWAGVPDAPYTDEATIAEGWQHCLTVPRVLTWSEEKQCVLQNPAEEFYQLRSKCIFEKEEIIKDEKQSISVDSAAFDLEVDFADSQEEKSITFENDLRITHKEGTIKLAFLNNTGEGRAVRTARLEKALNIRILKDASLLEIYVNDGELVFTTKYFAKEPENCRLEILGAAKKITIWEMEL